MPRQPANRPPPAPRLTASSQCQYPPPARSSMWAQNRLMGRARRCYTMETGERAASQIDAVDAAPCRGKSMKEDCSHEPGAERPATQSLLPANARCQTPAAGRGGAKTPRESRSAETPPLRQSRIPHSRIPAFPITHQPRPLSRFHATHA
ncbi:hypothetical protein G7Z17_g8211 [Cylindrodendrum hubeiense]|uniref:Uncharacterized protein n=1 Tax=Cylindrodendrum hubeiense TaxID=595255 RepID=A0A9P5L978_9HYPO|nr:hypothetical protein G7Z17_g8211 [Cylindrodendrum hubeiense]